MISCFLVPAVSSSLAAPETIEVFVEGKKYKSFNEYKEERLRALQEAAEQEVAEGESAQQTESEAGLPSGEKPSTGPPAGLPAEDAQSEMSQQEKIKKILEIFLADPQKVDEVYKSLSNDIIISK